MQSTSDALETLSDLLTSLTESPYSLELYSKYLQLVSVPELADQFEGAVELLTQFHAATDDVWLPFLQSKLRQLGISDDFESMEDVSLDLSSVTLDALLDLFELFRKAESDYFCEINQLSIEVSCNLRHCLFQQFRFLKKKLKHSFFCTHSLQQTRL